MIERDDISFLETREGLPDDLRFLVEQYPRGEWQAHSNIHGMAGFWLQRHDMFREMGVLLTGGIADYREGRKDAREFAAFFAPRLNRFLGNLDGHHNVEDHHYFPVFAEAEPRLKRGFDILDGDHHLIHDALERNAETANAFVRARSRPRCVRSSCRTLSRFCFVSMSMKSQTMIPPTSRSRSCRAISFAASRFVRRIVFSGSFFPV